MGRGDRDLGGGGGEGREDQRTRKKKQLFQGTITGSQSLRYD